MGTELNAVAIITARGGSKRIPGKNIREFMGKPMLVYGIEAALQAGIFREGMGSTGDGEIWRNARRGGGGGGFFRRARTERAFSPRAVGLSGGGLWC